MTIYGLNAFVSQEAAEPEVTETGRIRRKAASRLVTTKTMSKLMTSTFLSNLPLLNEVMGRISHFEAKLCSRVG